MELSSKTWKFFTIALLLTNIIAFAFYRVQLAKQVAVDYSRAYPFINPQRQFQKSDDVIVNIRGLQEYFNKLPEQNQDWADVSTYFQDMNSGSHVSVNPDLKLWPTNLLKTPLVLSAMRKVDKGEWDLKNTKFKLEETDIASDTALELKSQVGQDLTLRYLVERLLYESDDTAGRVLSRNLSAEERNSAIEAMGIGDYIAQNSMSARDYSVVLRTLYNASYLSEDSSNEVLKIMGENEFRELLNSRIPEEVKFAHKWDVDVATRVFSDAGIMYVGNKSFILSVMIKSKNPDIALSKNKAEELMAEIGENAHRYIVNK